MNLLNHYIHKFSKLHVARVQLLPAPHKPILLMAIMDGIEKREIEENKIYITSELVAAFKDYWHQLVHNPVFTANFSLPFYHLKSDSFWHLHTFIGREILLTSSHSIKSFAYLKEVVDYASFNEDLYSLLINENSRQVLKQTLLKVWFNCDAKNVQSNELIDSIINQILYEPAVLYKKRAEDFDEEEVFIRSGIFKKQVPRIYNYTCCISGMRIIIDKDVQMIDACHIIPFSVSHDDTISNGLSLCPNLHRAFDRGLIAIDKDYRVMVKPFNEVGDAYGIKQFADKQILLPTQKEYLPSLNNLAMHRGRFAF